MSVASGSGIKKKAPKKLLAQRNTARNDLERLMANKKKLVKALDKHEAKSSEKIDKKIEELDMEIKKQNMIYDKLWNDVYEIEHGKKHVPPPQEPHYYTGCEYDPVWCEEKEAFEAFWAADEKAVKVEDEVAVKAEAENEKFYVKPLKREDA